MTTVNIKALIDRPVESAKKPTLKPGGTYTGVIASFKFDESSQKKTPFVRLNVKNCQPTKDIAPEALLDPEDGTPMDLTKWSPYEDYYLTEDALYRVRELMESCKMSISGRKFSETIPELVNQPVVFSFIHETITDRQTNEARLVGKIGTMKGA
jgi:hypothetical protein